jgi:hypothetical protein
MRKASLDTGGEQLALRCSPAYGVRKPCPDACDPEQKLFD